MHDRRISSRSRLSRRSRTAADNARALLPHAGAGSDANGCHDNARAWTDLWYYADAATAARCERVFGVRCVDISLCVQDLSTERHRSRRNSLVCARVLWVGVCDVRTYIALCWACDVVVDHACVTSCANRSHLRQHTERTRCCCRTRRRQAGHLRCHANHGRYESRRCARACV
jgi:hypothetical protein